MSIREDFDAIYRSLSRFELQSGTDVLDFELPDLFARGSSDLWLGFYSEEGLRLALGRYGLWSQMEQIGYEEVEMELRCNDPEEHMLRIWSVKPEIEDAPLLELVVRRSHLTAKDDISERFGAIGAPVLAVEWLQLQRPDQQFSEDRPPLPGQQHPGLGIGREIHELLRQAAKRIGLEALVTVPSYFHNAAFYSREFFYADPHEQGLFEALERDVLPGAFGSVAAASWAVTWSMVTDAEGEPFRWFHDAMVAPISERLTSWLRSPDYRNEVERVTQEERFDVLEDALAEELETRGIHPLDNEKIERWIGDRV